MKKNDIDIILSRIERLSAFLEGKTLEDFQKEILRVEKYLQRFGKLDELLAHLKAIEKIAYTAKDFLNIDEVAAYLQVSKSFVYKLTSTKELTVYKPNGKNIFILRNDLNDWIKRNPCLSYDEIEKQANILSYHLENKRKRRTRKNENGKN